MEPLVVGLDLGTTLCKACAFELDGTAAGSAQKTVTTYRPQDGWAEQDPLEWRQAIIEVLAGLVASLGGDAKRIEAIGLSCHGPSLIPVDDRFRPLGRCPIWQDQRAAPFIQALIEKAGDDWIGLGTPESSFGVQLFWALQNQAATLQQAARLLDVKGYLLAFLTGEVVDEPSSSPGGQNVNQSLFDALGIDVHILAGSVPSLSIVGDLTAPIQNQVRLPGPVKIIGGLNDGASATLGAGIIAPGQGIVSLSTNGVMRTTVPQRIPGKILLAKSMFCYSYVNELYVTGGMTKCGGDSVKWWLENFYPGHESEASLFNRIADEAAASPVGANGIFFMPYLVGQGTPHPTKTAQGAFLSLGRHHTRADLTRALLEGAAFALKDIAGTFDALEYSWENLRFTGGGSKNPVWRQIVADVLGKPLTGVRSDSLLGGAMMAATGMGFFQSVQAAVQTMVKTTFQVEPVPENSQRYAQIYDEFTQRKTMLG
jgi:xylulokinase